MQSKLDMNPSKKDTILILKADNKIAIHKS